MAVHPLENLRLDFGGGIEGICVQLTNLYGQGSLLKRRPVLAGHEFIRILDTQAVRCVGLDEDIGKLQLLIQKRQNAARKPGATKEYIARVVGNTVFDIARQTHT